MDEKNNKMTNEEQNITESISVNSNTIDTEENANEMNSEKNVVKETKYIEEQELDEFKKTASIPSDAEELMEKKETHKKQSKKRTWKGIVTNISISVISSILTVSILSYVGFPMNESENSVSAKAGEETHVNTPSATYTTTFKSTSPATIADVAEELSPAIVGVVKYQQAQNQFNFQTQNVQSGSGSGVLYKKDQKYAYIITNNHVVEGASEVEVSLYDGKHTKAEIVGTDALTDIAVLRIDQKYANKLASFGDSSKLRPGEEVIAIGNPLGLEFSRTVTQGIVSATDRSISVNTSAGEWELSVIQTDAAINPGNSGGALINSQGEVIGINSLKISEEGVEGLGFAIPSNDVTPIAEELIEKGEIKRAYLGIQMYDMSNVAPFYRKSVFGSIEKGIIVAGIQEDSPAVKAGLQVNDVIVGIDGLEVQSIADFRKYLYKNVKPGDTIKIELYRNGKKQTVSIKTTEN